MVASIRGNSSFLAADPTYVKALPNSEARRPTDDEARPGLPGLINTNCSFHTCARTCVLTWSPNAVSRGDWRDGAAISLSRLCN